MALRDDRRSRSRSRGVGSVPGAVLVVLAAVVGMAGMVVLIQGAACSDEVDAALTELEPQEKGDLSMGAGPSGWGECTHRVTTARSGVDVVRHYRAQLQQHRWRVQVRSRESFAGQCSSGSGRCAGLVAVRQDVCFALTTDTAGVAQANDDERTTLFFFAVRCSDIDDPGERADFLI